MFKLETEQLLKQKNPCTEVYELALAWEKAEGLQIAVSIDRKMENLTNSNDKDTKNDDLAAILKGMQELSISQTKQVNKWSDAEKVLSEEGIKFRDDSVADIEQKSLATLKSFVGQKIKQGMQKIDQFRIRKARQQQLEISYHQNEGKKLKEFEKREEDLYRVNIRRIAEKRAKRDAEAQRLKEASDAKAREEEARKSASLLLRPLTEEESEIVRNAIYGSGSPSDVMAKVDSDIIVRESMQRLHPGQWLNDEIIHYFLIMLAKRDEELHKIDPSKGRSHFFKSFFMTKLLNEGHADPNLNGTYEYRNVKRWSKKVPGKDIFSLNKVIIPINQGGAHWVCAIIFVREKRIQMYDSLGGSGQAYLEYLFEYLKDEHRDKKKEALPQQDEWKLVPTQNDTPHQMNGFDCGVFTCMFADFLSRDCPLVFSQEHITQCRERIALSIMNGSALM
eukprot:CAMPEP_0178905878 /NCGR_PEP_ID=MMETSP0786-20121207/6520_1 /TAXON_ID=186022 /ORGANISM="Thalassionema frauenfeldii, Strain CCMP 1798" /LENGTH=448 /DNA_ID=CAMNT_0020577535 /DNA_START=249 /DNA_END=1595 /DNA_ORIENTATION=+